MKKREKSSAPSTETSVESINAIHVVFQEADVTTLQNAMACDESLRGEIVEIKDDFAVGPLEDLDTSEGWQRREAWWRELLQQSPYGAQNLVGSFDDRTTVHQLKEKLEGEEKVVWLWIGQNQHDVCGYFWLMRQLKEFAGRILVLFLNNLPFINEKGSLFYPNAIHKIPPKEFTKAKKLARKITTAEFETDPEEWNRLVADNALIRILDGGKKITSKSDDFYDNDILNGLTNEWQKGTRAMHSIYAKMKVTTGDVFLLWRMRKLVMENKIEMAGDPVKGWKEFEVRLKSPTPETLEISTTL